MESRCTLHRPQGTSLTGEATPCLMSIGCVHLTHKCGSQPVAGVCCSGTFSSDRDVLRELLPPLAFTMTKAKQFLPTNVWLPVVWVTVIT